MKKQKLVPAAIFLVLLMPAFAQPIRNSAAANVAKGDFFIVSSIDSAKKQILLKRPTEVTELMRVDNSTRYLDERGKALRLSDLRAGDTVYILSRPKGDQPVAVTIQKGPMTMEILRERYLKTVKQP